MDKKILCHIPWSQYCDYPLMRKLIKENLSKTKTDIKIIVPSVLGLGISENDSIEFINWLRDDLSGYATVENIEYKDAPENTRWSGKKSDGSLSFQYTYPFEYCIEKYTDYPYIARIETDFATKEWHKIEKILEKDFDFVTIGTGLKKHGKTEVYRPFGDVSFFVTRRNVLLNLPELTFLNIDCKHVNIRECHGHDGIENSEDYTLFNRHTHMTFQTYVLDHFQWMLSLIMKSSDKVYVIDPNKVLHHHFVGKTSAYYCCVRGNKHIISDKKYDGLLRYINYMKSELDIDNYNLFPPYKKLIEKYYDEHSKQ